MKNKKILMFAITLTFLVFTMSNISAIEDLGTFKENEDVQLMQNCDCTSVNITTILRPDGTILRINEEMQRDGSSFNYTLNSNNTIGTGEYIVNGEGNPNGQYETFSYKIEITPSGNSGDANTVFFIFAILLIYSIAFVGFFGKNIPMTIIGGMAMIFLGIYLVNNGIIIFRDDLTNYIAYITSGLGFIMAFWAAIEQMDVL